jgi:S-disulfanyl-L-cysteine oxidoreductase SoxD
MRTTIEPPSRGGARVAALAALLAFFPPIADAQTHYGIGRTATPEEIRGWDIDVEPDGRNFPPGTSSVAHGKQVYETKCAACHGDKGQGAMGDVLAGGMGTLASSKPVKTVGSFWPYASTLFDYIRRAMPLNAPQSLSAEDVYAVSGYVLFLNGLLPADATVNGKTLTDMRMPNRDGFVGDPRPDVHNVDCMRDCDRRR